jgi:hypothetical protein
LTWRQVHHYAAWVALVGLLGLAGTGALAPAGAAGVEPTGEIRGVVSEAGGPAIEHTMVCSETVSGEREQCAETGLGGEYALAKLAEGEYHVRFTGEVCWGGCRREFAPLYYNGKSSRKTADVVHVVSAATAGVDGSLEKGGRISGTVIQVSNGQAIDDLEVCGFQGGPWSISEEEFLRFLESEECVLTDAGGNYALSGLAAGDYTVWFTGVICSDEECREEGEPYVPQFYDGASLPAAANAVSVSTPGGVTENIDASMLVAEQPSLPAPPFFAPAPQMIAPTTTSSSTAAGTASGPGSATVKNGSAAITLRCSGGPCNGTLKLLVRVTEKLTVKRYGRSKKAKRTRSVVIGESGFAIAAGDRATVKVHLTRRGRMLLRKAGKRGLKVTLSGSGIRGGVLVLKQARHKK